MADTALSILQRKGEQRGETHIPDTADFDEHIAFYKGAVRITRVLLAFMAVLLLGMFFFLVK